MINKIVRTMAISFLIAGALAASATGEDVVTVDMLANKWMQEWPIHAEVQTFSPDEKIMAELVVASEQDALETAISAILRIESLDTEALADYTPEVMFKSIGTEYSYDVKLTPQDSTAQHYYIEVGASFPDNMLRYHVLSEDGRDTLSIKFFSGTNKEIREQEYHEYMNERAGG